MGKSFMILSITSKMLKSRLTCMQPSKVSQEGPTPPLRQSLQEASITNKVIRVKVVRDASINEQGESYTSSLLAPSGALALLWPLPEGLGQGLPPT